MIWDVLDIVTVLKLNEVEWYEINKTWGNGMTCGK